MNKSQQHQTDSQIYNLALSLLRTSLWGESRFPFRAPAAADWNAVYKELKQQTVQHLAVDLLVRENPADSQQYIRLAAKNMMRWYKIMQVQQKICRLFQSEGIPCAVIKGSSAACHYPRPENRVMGDIDLLIAPEHFDLACRLIASDSEFLGENFRHKEYKYNGVCVELHRAFATFREDAKKQLFDRRVFDAVSRAESVCTEQYSFFRLPVVENGLILLTHIDVHMENGLGLRQIIDWMMYVDAHLDDALWNSDFGPFVRQLERETLAVTVTRMCQMYLGLRTDITWCADADESLCRELMDYILHQGNFGRKTQRGSNRAANVISASVNPFSFFRILQHRGCLNWKALTRFPFLKPFAWLYQLIHYIHRGLRSDRPVRFLITAIRRSKSHTSFLETLGVSRMAQEGEQ